MIFLFLAPYSGNDIFAKNIKLSVITRNKCAAASLNVYFREIFLPISFTYRDPGYGDITDSPHTTMSFYNNTLLFLYCEKVSNSTGVKGVLVMGMKLLGAAVPHLRASCTSELWRASSGRPSVRYACPGSPAVLASINIPPT